MKEIRFDASRAARIYESADIRVTGGDNSVEGRVNFFKRLQRFQLLHIGLIGFDDRFISVVRTDGIVHVLLRHSMGLEKVFVTILRDLSKPEIGLGGGKIATRLSELLVHYGRRNHRQ